jgi:hypothetical protein
VLSVHQLFVHDLVALAVRAATDPAAAWAAAYAADSGFFGNGARGNGTCWARVSVWRPMRVA